VDGQPRNYAAAVDAVTGAVTPWAPDPNGTVFGLSSNGGTVYAGGDFSSIGGAPRISAAAVDGSGTATSWIANANSRVYALAANGPNVYAGGTFTLIGGVAQSGIAAIYEGTTGVDGSLRPTSRLGLEALPNPFHEATTIRYALSSAARVRIEIFDLMGRRVATPVRDVWMTPGTHEVRFETAALPNGLYLGRMQVGTEAVTLRMVAFH
jgi:hypothetical protein